MITLLIAHLFAAASLDAKALAAQPPITVLGGSGNFDFMNVDNKDRLAFACQPGKSAVVVINLDTDEERAKARFERARKRMSEGSGTPSRGPSRFARGRGETADGRGPS